MCGAVFLGSIAAAWALYVAAGQSAVVGAVGVPVIVGVPALYMAGKAMQGDRSDTAFTLSIDEVTERLAQDTRRFWSDEAHRRGLIDPVPLPVPWDAADEHLVTDWDRIAREAAEWRRPASSESPHATRLCGTGNQVADVLAGIPTRRLVVLGDKGAGKTTLLIRLALRLTADRGGPGEQVPVLLPLADWSGRDGRFLDWVVDQIGEQFPDLKRPYGGAAGSQSCARQLVDERRVMLLIDGLDEIPESRRRTAITRINDDLDFFAGVVLTSRTTEYRETVGPTTRNPVRLRGAAGIELGPVALGDVKKYLTDAAGGEAAAEDRWRSVLVEMDHDGSGVNGAFRSPLMVSLAVAVYRLEHDDLDGAGRGPDELCRRSRQQVERHLLTELIPTLYRPHRDRSQRCLWTRHPRQLTKVRKWLAFLAQRLTPHGGHAPDRAWWYLEDAVSTRLVGAVIGSTTALFTGTMAALAAAAVTAPGSNRTAWLWTAAGVGIMSGVAAGTVSGSEDAVELGARLTVLGRTGEGIAYVFTIWAPAMVVRSCLAVRGRLPWRLSRFLKDAHMHHGVLRRSGQAYEFRHAELQRQLTP
ncbi:NACHT domain-containing protein [Streptomyces sp. NPDC001902]